MRITVKKGEIVQNSTFQQKSFSVEKGGILRNNNMVWDGETPCIHGLIDSYPNDIHGNRILHSNGRIIIEPRR
jgi:hypothetical protein